MREREDAYASIRFLYLRIDHFYMNFFSLFICLFPQFLIFLPMSWVAPGVLWERTKKKKKNGQIGTFSMETVIFFYHFFLLYDWWWQFFPFLKKKKRRDQKLANFNATHSCCGFPSLLFLFFFPTQIIEKKTNNNNNNNKTHQLEIRQKKYTTYFSQFWYQRVTFVLFFYSPTSIHIFSPLLSLEKKKQKIGIFYIVLP